MKPQAHILRRIVLAAAGGLLLSGLSAQAETQLSGDSPNHVIPQFNSPLSENISTQLQAGSEIYDAYRSHGFSPLWIDGAGNLNASGLALLDAFSQAGDHALPPARYRAGTWKDAFLQARLSGSPDALAGAELELTKAFLIYARDLSSGILEPRRIDKELNIDPERPEVFDLLAGATRANDMAAYLADLAPQSQEYAGLKQRYAEIRRIAANGGWGPKIPSGKTLEVGDRSERVPVLRARLIALGDYSASGFVQIEDEPKLVASNDVTNDAAVQNPLSDSMVFDIGLGQAVRAFQDRNGLNADGLVGPATLAALNTSAEFRARQIAVNLERLRWLNKDLGDPRVMVNLAGFMMTYIEDGKPRFTSRVVVGKARRFRTPEFSDELEFMVVNPSWNVPRSIAKNEILPKLQENPNYLAENDMELVGNDQDPATIDWAAVTPQDFPGKVRQRPGSGNALGFVKFLFPNQFSIYLHDTPSRSLFAKDMRAYSHGCVRVQKPYEFARVLLSAQEADPAGKFQSYLDSGRERWVTLEHKVPVHLTYRTAWIDDQGRDQFRNDIYRRDRTVIAALVKMGVSF